MTAVVLLDGKKDEPGDNATVGVGVNMLPASAPAAATATTLDVTKEAKLDVQLLTPPPGVSAVVSETLPATARIPPLLLLLCCCLSLMPLLTPVPPMVCFALGVVMVVVVDEERISCNGCAMTLVLALVVVEFTASLLFSLCG